MPNSVAAIVIDGKKAVVHSSRSRGQKYVDEYSVEAHESYGDRSGDRKERVSRRSSRPVAVEPEPQIISDAEHYSEANHWI